MPLPASHSGSSKLWPPSPQFSNMAAVFLSHEYEVLSGKSWRKMEVTSCGSLFLKLLVLLGLPALMLCSAFKWLFSISCATFVTVFSTSISLILTGHPLSDAECHFQRAFL